MTGGGALPTRWRIYRLLRDGHGVKAAAGRCGIKKSSAHEHALALEKAGALRRIPRPAGSPLTFEAGARSNEVEDAIKQHEAAPGASGRGRVGRSAPAGAVRVHRGGYKYAVASGPERAVPWERRWNPNDKHAEGDALTDFSLRRAFPDGAWRFWMKRSAAGAVLVVQPPEEFVFDPKRVLSAQRDRRSRVRVVAGAFAKEYGLRLASSAPVEVPGQPVEYGIAAPGAPPFGVPGVSPVWVDESPGEGQPEVETASPVLAATLLDLPRWERATSANLAQVADVLAAHARAIEQSTEAARGLAALAPPRPLSGVPATRADDREVA